MIKIKNTTESKIEHFNQNKSFINFDGCSTYNVKAHIFFKLPKLLFSTNKTDHIYAHAYTGMDYQINNPSFNSYQ